MTVTCMNPRIVLVRPIFYLLSGQWCPINIYIFNRRQRHEKKKQKKEQKRRHLYKYNYTHNEYNYSWVLIYQFLRNSHCIVIRFTKPSAFCYAEQAKACVIAMDEIVSIEFHS